MFNSTKLLNNTLIQSGVFRYYCIKATKSKPTATTKWPLKNVTKMYGQPTSGTHPHLLKDGEVLPYIQQNELQERRQKLIENITYHTSKYNKDIKRHLIIVPSATKQYMSDKIPYVFRQSTDFLYLSGCLEPDSCLVLATTESPSQHCVTMFMRETDSHSELWDGPRTSIEDAVGLFGVDQALPVSELGSYIKFYMKSNPQSILWYDYITPVQKNIHKVMQDFLNEKFNKLWESPNRFIHQLRLIKSPAEIKLMQKSCDIASDAIAKTIRFARPGLSEHQIFANMEYECKMNGAEYLAYPPVVAGGNRANIIHYINNNQIVNDGEMVLMDAGCEYHGYSSDITRTWPINGKFNQQQIAIYEALLDVQADLIKMCCDFPSLDYLFETMCTLLGKQLQNIGLIPKTVSSASLIKMAYQFCPHHVSHYLGMDVHDTSTISRSIKIEPGMIITVEPGVYVTYNHRVPKEFQGMGVRIEDDVLITENGPVVLTKNCPKSVEDIERLAKENQV
ncbi:hypothetical protein ILUMI_05141 [Ignelater luminosus]|uniref:Aminopeptidase P N-terminal domain-containing protein n=1 Tax=Ignelater luminosus TaxID=2038154 RepID=A0A8K0D7Q7_IGNLU|nr:hypothetical protein ILUMI_05141 [Ignelater luminosus]